MKEKNVTIRDVAKHLGVSIATVSRAISQPDRVSKKSLERVQKAVNELGYRPNLLSQNFRYKRSNTLIVLIPNIENLFFSQLIRGIESVAQQAGFNVLLGDTQDSPERELNYINLVETQQADGIIQLATFNPEFSIIPSTKIPLVSAGGSANTPYPTIRIDNIHAAADIARHLIALEHTEFAVITGLKNDQNTHERLKGFCDTLLDHSLSLPDTRIYSGDYSLASGYENGLRIIAKPESQRPSAIFCFNDEMAMGACKAIREAGLNIPEDISVIGFDGLQIGEYNEPALTTIMQPGRSLGEQAARYILQWIDGDKPDYNDVIVEHQLLIRQSCDKHKVK
ncbi:LacI family transcriptional regulator [Thalassotalea litorea]|uniref:LacI family transcriptional regulator n=1 Tax=Thalassotalea litorea TaxID=2020715 RepID=A0A5R9IM85_9GAMM|nr:LacI family DNA-binding transcriptional regulator [Thalassotalea litorea]TLU64346.1 LacI family transcriptional regulator [Thalassotalea litorea]